MGASCNSERQKGSVNKRACEWNAKEAGGAVAA